MIEVFAVGNRWGWAMLCPAGRRLVWSRRTYRCMFTAQRCGKRYRAVFFTLSGLRERQVSAL